MSFFPFVGPPYVPVAMWRRARWIRAWVVVGSILPFATAVGGFAYEMSRVVRHGPAAVHDGWFAVETRVGRMRARPTGLTFGLAGFAVVNFAAAGVAYGRVKRRLYGAVWKRGFGVCLRCGPVDEDRLALGSHCRVCGDRIPLDADQVWKAWYTSAADEAITTSWGDWDRTQPGGVRYF
jgi:hypothetical protein